MQLLAFAWRCLPAPARAAAHAARRVAAHRLAPGAHTTLAGAACRYVPFAIALGAAGLSPFVFGRAPAPAEQASGGGSGAPFAAPDMLAGLPLASVPGWPIARDLQPSLDPQDAPEPGGAPGWTLARPDDAALTAAPEASSLALLGSAIIAGAAAFASSRRGQADRREKRPATSE